ncbi:MAG: flap endonuclease [Acidimicrobiia bacterium]|nr:flap endonuclease [Acidimicrobiia bacterium]
MYVHLVDGTYELFRHFFAKVPRHLDSTGRDMTGVRGVTSFCLGLLENGATHVGVATDHVIESFRNELWPGYKTGEGIDPTLMAQFEPLEDTLRAAGFTVWAMVDLEADDALGAAAAIAADDAQVDRVFICTPDKDLAQCVQGDRIVQFDVRSGTIRDAAGVREKFGVTPTSIPDWLALGGDSADGFPGVPGWGAKSATALLARYVHLDDIPLDHGDWDVEVRGAAKLSFALRDNFDTALLFRDLATLRSSAEVGAVPDWRWTGAGDDFAAVCERLRTPDLLRRAEALAAG